MSPVFQYGLPISIVAAGIAASVSSLPRADENQDYSHEPPPVNRDALFAVYSERQVALLEKLNRTDRNHLHTLPVLVVPTRWDLPETEYSPLPRYDEWAAAHPKALVVDLPSQVFGAYENGRLVYWGPVSSGEPGHLTPPGVFHLIWKSKGRISTENSSWYLKWYFNFHSQRGLAFHTFPLPGEPVSHACLRMLERDARWLYGWGEPERRAGRRGKVLRRGTPVRIAGQYAFNAPPPWRSMENSD
ncbi:MAG: L,D-transpeptidase [Bryobacteraceae bacterium]